MKCGKCGADAWCEIVDVEIGIIQGPYGCQCGWSSWECFDQTPGPTSAEGFQTDQWGWMYPDRPAVEGSRSAGGEGIWGGSVA